MSAVTRWPILPGEGCTIRQIRREVQKPLEEEELWAWLILRRISLFFSLPLSRIPWLVPNHITASAVILAFAIPWGLISFQPPAAIIIASLAFQLVYTLDLVDGEVARLTGRFSRLGRWMDDLLVHLLDVWLLVVLWKLVVQDTLPETLFVLAINSVVVRLALRYARADLGIGMARSGYAKLLAFASNAHGFFALMPGVVLLGLPLCLPSTVFVLLHTANTAYHLMGVCTKYVNMERSL